MKEVKGFSRTVGGSGVGPSSVMGRVRGGVSNREFGGAWLLRERQSEGTVRATRGRGGVGKANTGGGAHFGHAEHW